MAITTSVLDNFNRSNTGPPPSASWDYPVASGEGGLKVVSNALAPNARNTPCSGYWKTAFGAPCEVYATISNNAGIFELYCRLSDVETSAQDGYGIYLDPSNGVVIFKIINGTYTQLGDAVSATISNGHKYGLTAIGTTLTLWRDTGSGWSSVTTRTDSSITAGGYVGALIYSASGTARLDDFGGGTQVQTITPDKATSTPTVYAPTLTGAQTVTPDIAQSSSAVYAPTLTPGAVTITLDKATSTATVYAPALTPGTVTITLDRASSTPVVYEPTLTPGAVTITLDMAVSTPTVYEPGLSGSTGSITPDMAVSASVVYEPALTPGVVTITLDMAQSTATVYAPTLTGSAAIVPDIASRTATVYAPTLTPGTVVITLDMAQSVAVVYEPVITGGLVIVPATDGVGEYHLVTRDLIFALPVRDNVFELPARDNVFLIPPRDMEFTLPARDLVLEVEER